jgi:hypothetical protein
LRASSRAGRWPSSFRPSRSTSATAPPAMRTTADSSSSCVFETASVADPVAGVQVPLLPELEPEIASPARDGRCIENARDASPERPRNRPRAGPIRRAARLAVQRKSEPLPRRGVVAITGNGGSLYGAQRSQPVATGGKWPAVGNGSDRPKPLPWVATGCRRSSMVRRGSAVPVRQRALQKSCKELTSVRVQSVGGRLRARMESLMELSRRERRFVRR